MPSLPSSTDVVTETSSSSLIKKEAKEEAEDGKLKVKAEDSQFNPQRLVSIENS